MARKEVRDEDVTLGGGGQGKWMPGKGQETAEGAEDNCGQPSPLHLSRLIRLYIDIHICITAVQHHTCASHLCERHEDEAADDEVARLAGKTPWKIV